MLTHPLFFGSSVMIFGTNIANFIAYVYHLIFGRLLGPSYYGELTSLISILGIGTAAFSFLGLVVIKFSSTSGREGLGGIYYVVRKIMIGVLIIALVLVLFTFPLSAFLRIRPLVVILLSPLIFFSFLHLVYSSFLQGLLKFKESVFVNISGSILKLLLGLLLFYLGMSVFGVVLGLLLSAVYSWLMGRHLLGKITVNKKAGKKLWAEIFEYSIPVLVATVFLTSFISSDMVLVKHFFDSATAGIYASLSTLGKIIFYAAAPVSAVMFPMVSKKFSEKQSTKKVFWYSLSLTLVISMGVLFIYRLFPDFIVLVLFGKDYLSASPYLFWFGVFSTIFTLDFLLVNYYLSKNQTFPAYFVLFGAFIQASGIYFFHDSILTVISVSIFSSGFLLILLLTFGFVNYGKVGNLSAILSIFKNKHSKLV